MKTRCAPVGIGSSASGSAVGTSPGSQPLTVAPRVSPAAATELIGALVQAVGVPVQVHSHMTSGMAVAMYLSAVKAGAGAIDTAVSTMSGFSSQPPTETLMAIDFAIDGLSDTEQKKTYELLRTLRASAGDF